MSNNDTTDDTIPETAPPAPLTEAELTEEIQQIQSGWNASFNEATLQTYADRVLAICEDPNFVRLWQKQWDLYNADPPHPTWTGFETSFAAWTLTVLPDNHPLQPNPAVPEPVTVPGATADSVSTELQGAIAYAQSMATERTATLANLKTDIDALKTDSDNLTGTLEDSVEIIKTDLEALKTDISNLSANLQSVSDRLQTAINAAHTALNPS